jgi:outer membrane protein assembly factor BamB
MPLPRLLPLLCLATLTRAAEPAGDWIHARGDEAMRGLSPVELRFPMKPLWQFRVVPVEKARGEMLVASAVVRAGKVYAGGKEGKFYCLDLATGAKLWEAEGQGAKASGELARVGIGAWIGHTARGEVGGRHYLRRAAVWRGSLGWVVGGSQRLSSSIRMSGSSAFWRVSSSSCTWGDSFSRALWSFSKVFIFI